VTGSMPERFITPLIVIALLLGTLLALRSINSSSVTPVPVSSWQRLPWMVLWSLEMNRITEILRGPLSGCPPFPYFWADGRIGPPSIRHHGA
jgi:hypothetical protein